IIKTLKYERRIEMAINPEVLIAGRVIENREREFPDDKTGEMKRRGNLVTLQTSRTFFPFTIPVKMLESFNPQDGDRVAVVVEILPWDFMGKSGTAYVFVRQADYVITTGQLGDFELDIEAGVEYANA